MCERLLRRNQRLLTLYQTPTGFYGFIADDFIKNYDKMRNCSTYLIISLIFHYNLIVVCNLFQIGNVQNVSFGKGLRHFDSYGSCESVSNQMRTFDLQHLKICEIERTTISFGEINVPTL